MQLMAGGVCQGHPYTLRSSVGNEMATRVPSPGAVSISMSPLASRTRSLSTPSPRWNCARERGSGRSARNPRPSEEEVRIAIQGNICRCTGYVNIVEAVVSAGGKA